MSFFVCFTNAALQTELGRKVNQLLLKNKLFVITESPHADVAYICVASGELVLTKARDCLPSLIVPFPLQIAAYVLDQNAEYFVRNLRAWFNFNRKLRALPVSKPDNVECTLLSTILFVDSSNKTICFANVENNTSNRLNVVPVVFDSNGNVIVGARYEIESKSKKILELLFQNILQHGENGGKILLKLLFDPVDHDTLKTSLDQSGFLHFSNDAEKGDESKEQQNLDNLCRNAVQFIISATKPSLLATTLTEMRNFGAQKKTQYVLAGNASFQKQVLGSQKPLPFVEEHLKEIRKLYRFEAIGGDSVLVRMISTTDAPLEFCFSSTYSPFH